MVSMADRRGSHRELNAFDVDLLRVQDLTVRTQADVEDAAAVALTRGAIAGSAAAARRAKEDGQHLFAATDQVAVDLVHQAALDRHVDRGAEQDQDHAQDEHAPGDQAPANAGEQPVHSLIV
jgi:hypothetical protein